MSAQNPILNTNTLMPVSDYEEQIWMQQLQQPEQVTRHVGVWTLGDNTDNPRLIQAVENSIEGIPDLNVRYYFSEDGDLSKYKYDSAKCCLHTLRLDDLDLHKYVSNLKKIPWNAASNPPFQSFIIHTKNDIALILELHPILDQICQLTDIIKAIQQHYNEQMEEKNTLNLTKIDTSFIDKQTRSNDLLLNKNQLTSIILQEFRATLAEPSMTEHDDFFDYGGHSLLATRIIGKLMQSHGIEIVFNDFFKSPSAAALAQYVFTNHTDIALAGVNTRDFNSVNSNIGDNKDDSSATFKHEAQAPLTLAQQFLWHAYTNYDFSPIYNLPFAIAFSDKVDEHILYEAFIDIVERHASLRTMFQTQEDVTTQRIIPIQELERYKWFWFSDESQGVTLADEAAYRFELLCELPLRIRFLPSTPNEPQVLSLLIHHMVIDEWSLNTIMKDLSYAYRVRTNSQAPHWNTAAGNINDFAMLQQKQGINQQHVDYWVKMLRGAPKGLTLADPNSEAAVANVLSTKAKWINLDLGTSAYKSLLTVARQSGSSLFSVIYTAIALSLYIHSDAKDIVIGTSASGRTDPEFFDTVGYFTTMVAHRILFDADQSIESLLNDITFIINDSVNYADIPIDLIQKSLGMSTDDGLLFDVYIHIHSNNALNGSLDTSSGSVRYTQIPPIKDNSMFGLHFEIMDNILDNGQHALHLVTTYQEDRYSSALVENICTKIRQILTLLTTTNGSQYRLSQLPLLPLSTRICLG